MQCKLFSSSITIQSVSLVLQLTLLDFGASRSFSAKFVDDYIRIIKAASEGDREGVRHWSIESGFLTGYETKVYVDYGSWRV